MSNYSYSSIYTRDYKAIYYCNLFLKDDIGLWDMIKTFRAELYKKGMKPEDVAKQVGITFFNSPE